MGNGPVRRITPILVHSTLKMIFVNKLWSEQGKSKLAVACSNTQLCSIDMKVNCKVSSISHSSLFSSHGIRCNAFPRRLTGKAHINQWTVGDGGRIGCIWLGLVCGGMDTFWYNFCYWKIFGSTRSKLIECMTGSSAHYFLFLGWVAKGWLFYLGYSIGILVLFCRPKWGYDRQEYSVHWCFMAVNPSFMVLLQTELLRHFPGVLLCFLIQGSYGRQRSSPAANSTD